MAEMQWGLKEAVPPTALAAWGARVIVTQAGEVDVVPDRVDLVGADGARAKLLARLTRDYSMARLRNELSLLLSTGEVDFKSHRQFVLYADKRNGLTVMGDCCGSAGYCYLAAWLEP